MPVQLSTLTACTQTPGEPALQALTMGISHYQEARKIGKIILSQKTNYEPFDRSVQTYPSLVF